MKATSVAMVAAVLLSALGAHAGDTVTSVNVVGYITTSIPDGEWALLSLPLEDIDGSGVITMSDILSSAPNATEAWVYQNDAWVKSETYSAFGGGWTPGTNEYIRSDALFVKAPQGGGDIEITVVGEVPAATVQSVARSVARR